eukprot:53801-Prorocentrum_lima.AAC.1
MPGAFINDEDGEVSAALHGPPASFEVHHQRPPTVAILPGVLRHGDGCASRPLSREPHPQQAEASITLGCRPPPVDQET